MNCPRCGAALGDGYLFCGNCGHRVAPEPAAATPAMPEPETTLLDTGLFPVTWLSGTAGTVNGRLTLSNRRLVFKPGKLQGIGGTYTPAAGGVFIPNWRDAAKAGAAFSIPIEEITGVATGWASLTVKAGNQDLKFGAMRNTAAWKSAIESAAGLRGTTGR